MEAPDAAGRLDAATAVEWLWQPVMTSVEDKRVARPMRFNVEETPEGSMLALVCWLRIVGSVLILRS